jgi:hypothetical protein
VSATRSKTRKHEKQRVVSKRVFCLPSDIHLALQKATKVAEVKMYNLLDFSLKTTLTKFCGSPAQ